MGTGMPASVWRLMPWTAVGAGGQTGQVRWGCGRAAARGQGGVQPRCPAPRLPSCSDGWRGPEPRVAGETGGSTPRPTEIPLFLSSQRLSNKAHVAPRAVRRDNHPLQTTGPSGALPAQTPSAPRASGEGARPGTVPGGRGACRWRGVGGVSTLERTRLHPPWVPGRASANALYPSAQSGPGSGGAWGPGHSRGDLRAPGASGP